MAIENFGLKPQPKFLGFIWLNAQSPKSIYSESGSFLFPALLRSILLFQR